jgi:hypothetical protein
MRARFYSENTMSNAAAFLRPSAASTWMVCHGMPAMRALYPDIPDEADDDIREDGTACHWLASEVHAGFAPPIDSLSPNGRVLTEEMYDAVDLYMDVLRAWPNPAVIERPISASAIHHAMNDCTPDAQCWDIDTMTLNVADLKFGFRFVEVWDNWQLLCYVIALVNFYGLARAWEDRITVNMTIVQPRNYHRDGPVRTWSVKLSDLREHFARILAAAEACMQPQALLRPNPGCTDCPARHACPSLQQAALTALDVAYKGVPLELTPAAVGDELRRLMDGADKLEARITGLKQQAESLIRSGTNIPHFDLAASYAREGWREGTNILALAPYYGVDPALLTKPVKPVSPAQARKVLPANVVAAFAHKPSTGVKLVKQDKYAARKKFTTL